MTDDPDLENGDPAEVPTAVPVVPAGADAVAILQLVLDQLQQTEARILSRINEIEAGRIRRWREHEKEHEQHAREHAEIEQRLTKLEENDKLDEERALVWRARYGPVRNGMIWMVNHWKDMVILILGVAAAISTTIDVFTK